MSNILYYLAFTMISILFVFFLFMLVGWRWLMKRIVKQIGKDHFNGQLSRKYYGVDART